MNQIRTVLRDRIPEAAMNDVVFALLEPPVSLLVSRDRSSKLGDYRPARQNQAPRISVNHSLNRYAFLITLIHEIAHHHVQHDYELHLQKFTWKKRKKPLPHGDEWKAKFRKLMGPFLNTDIFPADIFPVIQNYFIDPKASSSADHALSLALKRYDPPDETMRLEDLPFDAVFTIHGRRYFRKKERLRSRFRCICMKTNRIYLVSAGAPVVEISHEQGNRT